MENYLQHKSRRTGACLLSNAYLNWYLFRVQCAAFL
nr:MAG TPA: hypothetical protein [Caudoviricetes sp.]